GLVEVRAELVPRVLAVLAGEELATQPDDRLVGAPVAVMLETLAVVLDHPLRVTRRPEDVVVEEAVAVVGRLLGDLRATDGSVPDEWGDAVQRTGGGGEALQRGAELPLPVHDVFLPEASQQG